MLTLRYVAKVSVVKKEEQDRWRQVKDQLHHPHFGSSSWDIMYLSLFLLPFWGPSRQETRCASLHRLRLFVLIRKPIGVHLEGDLKSTFTPLDFTNANTFSSPAAFEWTENSVWLFKLDAR